MRLPCHEGRDIRCNTYFAKTSSFNSHAREGRDNFATASGYNSTAFQLARPRGARPLRKLLVRNNQRVSTHAPARGATYTM